MGFSGRWTGIFRNHEKNIEKSKEEIKTGKTISLENLKGRMWDVSVEFTNTAEKQLYKLHREIQLRIIRVLERIKIRSFHFVKVIEVGHRKNIYD